MTRVDRDARNARTKEMAAQGFSTRQIADEFGISARNLRLKLHRAGIDVPADRIIGRQRLPNANRIVAQMVSDAENLTADVLLITFADLDRARIGEWADALTHASLALKAFIKQLLKERKNHGKAA